MTPTNQQKWRLSFMWEHLHVILHVNINTMPTLHIVMLFLSSTTTTTSMDDATNTNQHHHRQQATKNHPHATNTNNCHECPQAHTAIHEWPLTTIHVGPTPPLTSAHHTHHHHRYPPVPIDECRRKAASPSWMAMKPHHHRQQVPMPTYLCERPLQAWQGQVLSFSMEIVFMVFYLCG